jgi:hypothetical protein
VCERKGCMCVRRRERDAVSEIEGCKCVKERVVCV